MPKEENIMLLKMLFNRLLFTVLFSGFFMFGSQQSFGQEAEGASADTVEATAEQTESQISQDEAAGDESSDAALDPAAVEQGKALFTNNCTVCHSLTQKVVGPALAGVTERRETDWLLKFIQNSQKVIQSGDETAVALYEEFGKMQMPSFDYFSEAEILSILAYIEQESKAAAEGPVTVDGDTTTVAGDPVAGDGGAISSEYLTLIIAGFIFVLILILVVLILLVVVLTKFLKNKPDLDTDDREILDRKSKVGDIFKSKGFIGLLTFIFVAMVLRAVIEGLFTIGVQQGYAPTQPIAFSHALHAGEFQIDCNYCHTGVRKSKNANIPSANICMNCHSIIKKESPEIKKIYAALENNEPIEWVRIHNLPDLAYFNHAQHVAVGEVECQTCHGPVEEMVVVRQHAPLTMGWCINCHRETEINGDNEYYDKLVQLHSSVSKEPMTVNDIGGLECSKCHY